VTQGAVSFGRFDLDLDRRQLFREHQPVRLGSRALEILCVLAEAPGVLVTKDELMAKVWPNVVVEENNLQVHISALRKALATGGGESPIVTVPGRGYRLIGFETSHVVASEFAGAREPAYRTRARSGGDRGAPLLVPLSYVGRRRGYRQDQFGPAARCEPSPALR
jgi:DNA-binding winged helix-turn-helix (wHTH) protein